LFVTFIANNVDKGLPLTDVWVWAASSGSGFCRIDAANKVEELARAANAG